METEILIIIGSVLLLWIIVKICSSHLSLLSVNHNPSMPYERRNLLTDTEQLFYSILINEARKRNLHVCPKVRLEDIICVTDNENKNKYRGYIKSRHVDFVLINACFETVAAIELDDPSHNTEAAAKIDAFKNELFDTVGIALIRIDVKDDYAQEIKYAFDELQLPIVKFYQSNYRRTNQK